MRGKSPGLPFTQPGRLESSRSSGQNIAPRAKTATADPSGSFSTKWSFMSHVNVAGKQRAVSQPTEDGRCGSRSEQLRQASFFRGHVDRTPVPRSSKNTKQISSERVSWRKQRRAAPSPEPTRGHSNFSQVLPWLEPRQLTPRTCNPYQLVSSSSSTVLCRSACPSSFLRRASSLRLAMEFSRLVVPKPPRTTTESHQRRESTFWKSYKVRKGHLQMPGPS